MVIRATSTYWAYTAILFATDVSLCSVAVNVGTYCADAYKNAPIKRPADNKNTVIYLFIPLEVAPPRSSGLAPLARARLLTGLILLNYSTLMATNQNPTHNLCVGLVPGKRHRHESPDYELDYFASI